MAAVDVVRGRFDVQIDVAELRVGGERPPDAGVACVFGRAAQPRLVSRLALARNRVERPQLLARADVEGHDVALDVRLVDAAAGRQRRSDDDDVVGDHGRRAVADPARSDRAPPSISSCLKRSTMPLSPKPATGSPVLALSDDELEAGRDDDDPLFLAVSPVGHAAVHLARRSIESRAFVRPPGPQRLAGAGVGRHDVSARTGGEVEHAVHHDRRRLGVERLGGGAEVVEPPGPGDLQVLHVVAGDLIERRVARAAFHGAVGPPLAGLLAFGVGGAVLTLPGSGQAMRPRAARETRDDAVVTWMLLQRRKAIGRGTRPRSPVYFGARAESRVGYF